MARVIAFRIRLRNLSRSVNASSVITTLYYYKPALHYPRVVVTPAGNGMLIN